MPTSQGLTKESISGLTQGIFPHPEIEAFMSEKYVTYLTSIHLRMKRNLPSDLFILL